MTETYHGLMSENRKNVTVDSAPARRALVTGASALIRILRREGGRRTTAAALVLLIAAGGHAWVLCSRGLGNDESAPAAIAPAGSISADPADWDGALTTFSFNTHYSEAHKVELAVAIRRAAAEVVVLPETSAEYGQAVADLLAQDGLRYTVFSAGDQKDDADPTTVLVSAVIGDYEQAQAPAGAGHGAVLLRPAGGAELNGHRRPTILGVHTHAPVPGSMEEWLASVEAVVGQQRAVADLDGVGAARYLNDRRRVAVLVREMRRKPLRVDCRRGDNNLEVWSFR